jgi:hypothetical protein
MTPNGKIRRPSTEMMYDWILRACDMVSPQVIMKTVIKTGISNALERSEDDMLWTEGEDVGEEGVMNCSHRDTSKDDSNDE